ncbi:MAG: TolC family protein [Verrucomicrobiota bacterium]
MSVRKLLWPLVAVSLSACTASHYRRSADKEVYSIIQQAEKQVFGTTNTFGIETRFSDREPRTISPAELIQDRSQTNRRVVSLTQALDLAVEQSREYQAQKEQLYLSALALSGARYEFTPIFLASSTAEVDGTGSSAMVGSVRNRLSLRQFFRTGGNLSVSLANDLLRYFIGKPPGVARNSAIDTLTVDLVQPLLRGFGRNDPTVENLTQAERNVIYAVRSFSQYQKQFDVNIVNDYFGLLGDQATVRNNYTNYLRRVELTKYTEARAVDRVRAADVEDARSAELSARISYINSIAAYLNGLDAFKLRLGIPIPDGLYLQDSELADLEKVGLLPVDMSPDTAFRLAIENNLDILNAIDKFEDSKRKLRIAADQLKPGLQLFANATLESDPPDQYADFDITKVRYQAGLSLDHLFDKLPSRNTYRATLVSFESQIRSLIATLDNLRDRIERGFRTLEQQRQNTLNRRASLDVAARRVDMNLNLLEAGRVQVRDLREAQDALILAQNQLTDSVVNYLAARLQLLFEVGVLTTTAERFWLNDPVHPAQTESTLRAQTAPVAPQGDVVLPHQVLEPTP